jgi:hypothetical protein
VCLRLLQGQFAEEKKGKQIENIMVSHCKNVTYMKDCLDKGNYVGHDQRGVTTRILRDFGYSIRI